MIGESVADAKLIRPVAGIVKISAISAENYN